MDWISKVLEGKIASKIVALVCVASSGLLFLPDRYITKLRLVDFLKDYGKYVGVAFLLSAGFLAMNGLAWGFAAVRRRGEEAKKESQVLAREIALEGSVVEALSQLDSHEQAVMREFFLQRKNTILLPVDQHVVAGLLRKGLITIVSNTGQASLVGSLFPVSMSVYAERHINEQLIGFPKIDGKPTEEQLYAVMSTRPRFIDAIERHLRLRDF